MEARQHNGRIASSVQNVLCFFAPHKHFTGQRLLTFGWNPKMGKEQDLLLISIQELLAVSTACREPAKWKLHPNPAAGYSHLGHSKLPTLLSS